MAQAKPNLPPRLAGLYDDLRIKSDEIVALAAKQPGCSGPMLIELASLSLFDQRWPAFAAGLDPAVTELLIERIEIAEQILDAWDNDAFIVAVMK